MCCVGSSDVGGCVEYSDVVLDAVMLCVVSSDAVLDAVMLCVAWTGWV